MFCQMIAQLSELTESAEPTPFHKLLRALDERGKLLRVYTQNIDALESKSGMTFGVPKPTSSRSKPKSSAGPSTPTSSQTRLPSPPVEIPRVIPLHGTLETLHCVSCTHAYPLRDHLELLISGIPPSCPECTSLEETRQLIGKRSRGVGKLRPSVVLYNEDHKDGEQVGEAVRKDLFGNSKGKGKPRSGADLLLVVGTSLRVPGTKRIVREFSKAVRSRTSSDDSSPSPSPPVSTDGESPVTSVYLNFDFPVPMREWEGVFDVWLKGDAQDFARALKVEMDKELRAKEAALERKRQREEVEQKKPPAGKKRKAQETSFRAPHTAKRRKTQKPLAPSRKITIISDNIKKVTRLTSSSDEDESGQKIYLRIPARSSRLSVPEVVIVPAPYMLQCKKTSTAIKKPRRTPLVVKKPLVRVNVGTAKKRTKQPAATFSSEVVRNEYGLRRRTSNG